jgi:DNA-binding XRE family transcriptional regulator
MTPAEKAMRAKRPRKCKALESSRTKRNYPWVCNLRHVRQQHLLSLKDVAVLTGLSVAAIWEIERGSDPMLTTAQNLAEFFGLTTEELWPRKRKENDE